MVEMLRCGRSCGWISVFDGVKARLPTESARKIREQTSFCILGSAAIAFRNRFPPRGGSVQLIRDDVRLARVIRANIEMYVDALYQLSLAVQMIVAEGVPDLLQRL